MLRRHLIPASRVRPDRGLWFVLLLLLVIVLAPTAGVLWFMNKAVENQRVVVRQKLASAYRLHLSLVQERLDSYWREQAESLDREVEGRGGSAAFARCIRAGLADSVVVYTRNGRPLYPGLPQAPRAAARNVAWHEAAALEARHDHAGAARLYGKLANKAVANRDEAARALQAQARCLVRAGQTATAVTLVFEALAGSRFQQATDAQGRLIAADAELMALQLLGSPKDPRFPAIAARLVARLEDYGNPALGSAQRRFLIQRLRALPVPGSLLRLPAAEAEELAARFVDAHLSPPRDAALRSTSLPGVWQLASSTGQAIALFREPGLLARMRTVIASTAPPRETSIDVQPPAAGARAEAVFHSLPAGARLPGWRVAMSLDAASAATAGDAQTASYIWTGALVIGAMTAAALLIAGAIRRQLRVARLKNDLVATVTHELKTPLSSMRLLVDTLLDDEQFDYRKAREYLELIAKENTRLSRLIDNFLAFSRMERNKRALDFRRIRAEAVVEAAAEAVRERFHVPGCRLEVELAPGLPELMADPDALVTVVLNLLDNAYKYTGPDKRIRLRAFAEGGEVCFEVEDNGIGLSPRDAKRVFKRFYQVDRRLSRTAGGVGLGLSIVDFIVAAHGGRVTVRSRLGQGSAFTVRIPCLPVGSPATEEAVA